MKIVSRKVLEKLMNMDDYDQEIKNIEDFFNNVIITSVDDDWYALNNIKLKEICFKDNLLFGKWVVEFEHWGLFNMKAVIKDDECEIICMDKWGN